VYMVLGNVYMEYDWDVEAGMGGQARANKHFRLNAAKIKRAQKILRTPTETETIERALDMVLSEHERNRRVAQAHERFGASGAVIEDVFGNLEP
jgi:hypothetical protein